MALKDLMNLEASSVQKIGLSEERIRAVIPKIREYIAFWREYPDLFIDFLLKCNNPKQFRFLFYQRVFMRAAMRHRYFYGTFPRGYSKSFLCTMLLLVRAILFPGAKMFVASGGKEQSASIIAEKVSEICDIIPDLNNEINWARGKEGSSITRDKVRIITKGSNSYFDNLAISERSRGKRRHAGVMEEAATIDGKLLQEVVIPTMNIARRCADGTEDPKEILNKQQSFITTAGYRNSYAYDQLIQTLVFEVAHPDPYSAIVLGGTWRLPVYEKLHSKDFVKDLKMSGTYNDASFDREYESRWSGVGEDAFFKPEMFDSKRVLNQPEYEGQKKLGNKGYYIFAVDVGRKADSTEIIVFKVKPQAQGQSIKDIVNIFSYQGLHFETQAIILKRLYFKFKPKKIVIDTNGVGIGLVDYLVKAQTDPQTGDLLPAFGVDNDDDKIYKQYKTPDMITDILYLIKATAQMNSDMHALVQMQLSSGKIRLLIDERSAKYKLLETKVGKAMTPEQRGEYLKPFTLTSVLREQLLNLVESHEGLNIVLKKSNNKIQKDKFSALEMGLYYIKLTEDSKKKKRVDISKFMFYT